MTTLVLKSLALESNDPYEAFDREHKIDFGTDRIELVDNASVAMHPMPNTPVMITIQGLRSFAETINLEILVQPGSELNTALFQYFCFSGIMQSESEIVTTHTIFFKSIN